MSDNYFIDIPQDLSSPMQNNWNVVQQLAAGISEIQKKLPAMQKKNDFSSFLSQFDQLKQRVEKNKRDIKEINAKLVEIDDDILLILIIQEQFDTSLTALTQRLEVLEELVFANEYVQSIDGSIYLTGFCESRSDRILTGDGSSVFLSGNMSAVSPCLEIVNGSVYLKGD